MSPVDLGELGQQAEARKRSKPTNPPEHSRRRGVPQSQVGSSHLRRPEPLSPEAPSDPSTSGIDPDPAQQRQREPFHLGHRPRPGAAAPGHNDDD